MTEKEAIKELHNIRPAGAIIPQKRAIALDMAISALEEVQQYRAIGTPEELQDMKNNYFEALSDWRQYRQIGTLEECRAAREKQIPKRAYHISPVDDNDNANVECPACHVTTDYAVNVIKRGHCWNCGQKLDWGDEE